MNTQVRVGIFTILAIVGIFVIYYFITNLAMRNSGYQIAIHFRDIGGLQQGSTVLLSGVAIGEVDDVNLFPDQTAEAICTIAPGNAIDRDSLFIVSTTFTGQTTISIEPPPVRVAARILPEHPLPEEEQPWGMLPPTLQDLISAGQVQMRNLDKTLAVVNHKLPLLMDQFGAVAGDTDRLIGHTDVALSGVGTQLGETVALLDRTIEVNGGNLAALTGQVRGLVADDRPKLDALVGNLALTSANLNKTMEGIAEIAQDPALHQSLVGTAANMEDATAKLKAIATEIEGVTGDPNTQAELRGTIANLSAASAKADDILGRFSTAGPPNGRGMSAPVPGSTNAPSGNPPNAGAASIGAVHAPSFFSAPLVEAQIRETWGDKGGGPDSDLNLSVFPHARTHLLVGANDLGYHTTYNAMVVRRASPDLSWGGGVVYSNLGLAALFRPFGGPVGLDARLYDPKHPTFDLYGDLRIARQLQLFYGERSIWGTSAKLPSFGLQVDY